MSGPDPVLLILLELHHHSQRKACTYSVCHLQSHNEPTCAAMPAQHITHCYCACWQTGTCSKHNCQSQFTELARDVAADVQVVEAGGLQTLLALLPAPQSSSVSPDAASAPPAGAASTAAATAAVPSWANKPASHKLQTCLLQLLAAMMQSQPARSTLLADGSNSNVSSTACCAVLLNILDAEAPPAPAPLSAVVVTAGAKGAAAGKADSKVKANGKGKAEAAPPVPTAPPAELVPPYPASVQLPAVQCLQVRWLLAVSDYPGQLGAVL